MRIRTAMLAAAMGAALALGACGDATGPTPTLDGHWTGSFPVDGFPVVVAMTLSQGGQTVTGSGSFQIATTHLAFTVNGTLVNRSATLTISSPGNQPATYTATLEGTSVLRGTVDGSGFQNTQLTLTRQ